MRTFVVTPPPIVVSWADARAHLELETEEKQDMISGFIAAATAHIDGPDGWLGRALGPQTLEARFDGFDPCGTLDLSYPPLIDVVSVTYLDSGNVAQPLAVDAVNPLGSQLEPAFGTSWPVARWGSETVRVRYRAGYVKDPADDPLVPALPPAIRAAILMMTADLFENRSTTLDGRSAGAAAVPMSTTVENLLAPFRVYR